MSFILDALKKSETERQRADSPALYEMKMAPPRRGVATWLIVLAGLLVINIVVLTVVLLRGAHGAAPSSDAGTAAAPTAAPAPAPVAPAPANAVPATSAPGAYTVVGPGITASATVPGTAPVPAAAPPAEASPDPAPSVAAANRPSDDDAPAVDAPRNTAGTGGGEVLSYQQAASAPGANMPELTLDLHAYAANPAERFIFLNMTKLKEGQTSPQGVRVESITPDGAILSWQGSKFLLQRQ
jgi:general secretion pathway protein B